MRLLARSALAALGRGRRRRWPSSPTTGSCCCRSRSPALTLLAAPGAAAAVRLLGRLRLRYGVHAGAAALAAGDRRLRLDPAGRPRGAVLRPRRARPPAPCVRLPGWPVWAATRWVLVEALRGRRAVRRLPVGPAGVRDRGHPGRPGVRLRRRARAPRSWSPCSAPPWPGRCCAAAVRRCGRWRRRRRRRAGLPGRRWLPWQPTRDAAATVPPVGRRPGQRAGGGAGAFAERRAVLDNHVRRDPRARRPGRRRRAPSGPTWWSGRRTPPTSTRTPTRRPTPTIGGAVRGGRRAAAGGRGGGRTGPDDGWRNRAIVWSPGGGPGRATTQDPPGAVRRVHPAPRRCSPRASRRWTRSPATWSAAPARASRGRAGATVGDADVLRGRVRRPGARRGRRRRRRCIVVQTNNATYTGTGQIEQQFAMSRLRAIETGRYVVVAVHQRHLRASSPRTAASSSGRPSQRARRCSSTTVALIDAAHAGRAVLGPWPELRAGRRCGRSRSSLGAAASAIVGGRDDPAHDRGPGTARPAEEQTRMSTATSGRVADGGPDLQRGATTSSGSSAGVRAAVPRRRRAGRRRRLARTAPASSPTRWPPRDPQVTVAAPHREGRPGRGVPARLPGRPRARLRRGGRDGRRRLPPARAAAAAARRAARTPTW